jgi:hypothetical protein
MDTNIFVQNISKFDSFGATVNLQLLGDSQYKNIIGAIISLLTLAASLAMTFSTINNYINGFKPTLTSGIEYGITNTIFNYSTTYLAVSFYYPYANATPTNIDNTTNNFDKIGYINQLNITCTTCNGDYSKESARMNFCNLKQFTDDTITLKSIEIKE